MPVSRLPSLPASEVAAEQRRQQIAHIRDYYGQLARVDNVGFNIRVANRQFCKDTAPQLGLYAATVQSLPHKYRSYTHEALQLSWTRATAIAVSERSPAAMAGIRPGDQILTLDNEPVPPTGTRRWIERWLKAHGDRPVRIMVRRDGEDTLRTVYPVMACAIPIQVQTDPEPNAFTDYRRIVIQSGILRLTPTDEGLAAIIGHELAHVTLGHNDKKMQNAFVGGFGGALIDGGLLLGGIYSGKTFSKYFENVGARAYSVQFERESDYVGAYYAARAGYDISAAGDVWRSLSLEAPDSIRMASTHPITAVRFVQMQKVAAEIADKRRRQLPLVPDLKELQPPPQAARAGEF